MVNANFNGHNAELYLVNMETGEMTPFASVAEITETDALLDIDEENKGEVVGHIFREESFSCELTMTNDVIDADYYAVCDELTVKKPNPIYVPKHIARRRKW